MLKIAPEGWPFVAACTVSALALAAASMLCAGVECMRDRDDQALFICHPTGSDFFPVHDQRKARFLRPNVNIWWKRVCGCGREHKHEKQSKG